MPQTYHAIGLMSGSSLDGVDLAYCKLVIEKSPSFKLLAWDILEGHTFPFSEYWKTTLRQLPTTTALKFVKTNAHFGLLLGEIVNQFLQHRNIPIDLVASHGHTIFHDPANQFTTQIGDPAAIAALTNLTTVGDLRTKDVYSGGQGAPIAPIADKFFFAAHDFCLNLGGIANISAKTPDGYVAFDISGANQVLNVLAQEKNLAYDKDGQLAARGRLNENLLDKAGQLDYLKQPFPKSLSNQWVQEELIPIFKDQTVALEDRLHTACLHIAQQIKQSLIDIFDKYDLTRNQKYTLLATGGGALNPFLIHCIETQLAKDLSIQLIIPNEKIIEYKEAAFVALMGVMRLENVPNCIASVTGASRDVVGGSVY